MRTHDEELVGAGAEARGGAEGFGRSVVFVDFRPNPDRRRDSI
jgi:hypothetical protein